MAIEFLNLFLNQIYIKTSFSEDHDSYYKLSYTYL